MSKVFQIQNKSRWLLAASFFYSLNLWAAEERGDLKKALAKWACQGQRPTPQEIWDSGIYDVQINFKKLQNKTGASPEQLKKFAIRESRQFNHLGYVYGECDQKTSYVATVPSPFAFAIKDDKLQVSLELARRYCKRVDISFAHASGGKARSLAKVKIDRKSPPIFINTALLGSGSLSILCHPKKKAIASSLWNLIPVKKPKAFKIPAIDLEPWIQSIRKDHDLEPLTPQNILDDKIMLQSNVNHYRKNIKKIKSILKKNNQIMVGENRAIGQSKSEMMWMYWNSPSHRNLLLKSKAQYLNLAVRKTGSQWQSVIVLSRKR